MALTSEEKQILDFAKNNGKSALEAKAAIAKYRQQNPSSTPTTPTFSEDAATDKAQIGENIAPIIDQNKIDRLQIRAKVADQEITPVRGAFQTIGKGLGAGFKVLGESAKGLAKMALPQKAEDKISEFTSGFSSELGSRLSQDYEEMKTSDVPEERKIAEKITSTIERYNTDENFKNDVDATGGVLTAVTSLLGGSLAKNLTPDLKTRTLTPDLDTPYFKENESAVAQAISNINKAKNSVIKSGADVSGKVPLSIQALGQSAIDKAVLSGQKIAETYRNVVENSTQRITSNLDRQALKDNLTKPLPEVEQTLGTMYVNAVSPGVKGKKPSLEGLVANKDSAVAAIKNLTTSKPSLKFRDIETNEIIEGQLPTNLWEFGGAISHQKSNVYKEITNKLEATGNTGLDTTRIVDAMTEIIENPVYANETAIVNRARESLQKYLTTDYTPSQIEELIQLENDRLQAFYRGAGTQADAIVSAIVANNLRDMLDEAVDSATGSGIKELKSQYGNLKAIERDVVHRALHNAQAREAGLVDMFGIRTIGDVAAGAAGDLGALKRGAAQIAGESFIKALNDRDAMVNRMFLVADQAYTK